MKKIRLLLLACSSILGAMLLLANPVNATQIIGQIANPVLSTNGTQTIPQRGAKSHNSPVTLTAQDEISRAIQSGCSCSECQNRLLQLQGRMSGF